ncbi:DUF2076 domain-containing protein [Photobacterium nomapromontoriensis]|uniref:DUF2076 domain-containing protein n=1 Tax=Photobacterium nomapromontoriensis TaxID=2910237 RepID=UPI003D1234B0
MTPQEKELIQNVANKLKQSPNKTKDADAEQLITNEIGSQQDAVYKLTQAVLVQEMALKELKQKNEYLEQSAEYYKAESNRGTFSKMMGGSRPAPQPPQPMQQPSAFGSFMQTAASVAVGMVAGNMISNALFGNDDHAADTTAAADTSATDAPADATTDAPAADPTADTGAADDSLASADTGDNGGSFLDNSSGFGSDYTDNTGGFGDAGFGDAGFGDSGFGDSGFGNGGFDDSFANNDNGFGSDDSGFGGDDDFGFGDDDV